ncbi:MAG: polyprenyl synthetase family protein, partial [Myxococcota bacterium]
MERIAPSLALVERAMRDQVAAGHGPVGTIGEHVLSSGGKRLRPVLVMLSSELCAYDGPRRVQIAAAVELLHTATLLHDDVVDLAELRRGQQAARAIWGNRRAVLVGDFFYARASSMIVEDGDLDILWIFSDTIRRMAEGELLQLERSFDPDVTESHYYAVIDYK